MPLQTMYPAKLGSPQTTLAAALSADATVMILTDSSILPPAPNIAVLGVDENCEIIKYTAIDNSTNTVSGLVRAQGGSIARVWATGSVVARNSTSLDHNIFKENIEALDEEKAQTDHNHDNRYYTETEVDAALSGKQNSLTFDNTPTANSSNPVKSGGVKTYTDNKILYFYQQSTVATAAATTEFCRITDSRIDANTVVLNCEFTVPSAITSGVSWTSAAGYISFKGICTSTNCKVNAVLGQKGN